MYKLGNCFSFFSSVDTFLCHCNHLLMCTPLWKSNGTIFSTWIICLYFFAVYSSFHTWHTLWWSISIMLIFIGFRSLVTSKWHFEKGNKIKTRCRDCWPMQCALMTSGHGKNGRCWRAVGIQDVGINYYKLSKTIHKSIHLWPPGDAHSRKKLSKTTDHYSTVYAFGAHTIVKKDASGASQNYRAVYQSSTRPSASVDTFVQPPSQNQGYPTHRGQSEAISKTLLLYNVTSCLSLNKCSCWYHYMVISLSR